MKPLLLTISKRYPVMRALRHHYVVGRNRILWLRLRQKPLQQQTVIFQAYNGRYACSPKALYKEMQQDKRFNQYEFIWVVSDPAKFERLAKQPRTRLVTIRSKEYFEAFAQAKYWVVNCMLPLRIVKRHSQVMVQCWHGTPLKRLRNDIVEDTQNAMNARQDFVRKNKLDTPRYDYFISPSAFATEKFISAFGIEKMQNRGQILEIGYPRNDALYAVHPQKIVRLKQHLGLPADKKILLYAPTWRDDQHDSKLGYTHKNKMDFSALQSAIGDEYIVLFRAHYLIANSFNFAAYEGFVYDVSTYEDINDLYIVSDALITDYSSSMFDYANLQKPMLFFMYDLEHYEQNLRGFYIDIAELPGEIIYSQERLATCLKHIDQYEETHRKKYQAFAQRYVQLDDGLATARLLSTLFDPPPLPAHHTLPLRRYQSLVSKEGIHNG